MVEQSSANERISPAIRPMTLDDVNEVYIIGSSTPEFSAGDAATFWERDELERWVTLGVDDVLLIAEVNGQIGGFLLAKYHVPTKLGAIHDVFTKPEFRRNGVAEALEEEAILQLTQKGATYIYSVTQHDNQASMNLQEKVGFKKGKLMQWFELEPER